MCGAPIAGSAGGGRGCRCGPGHLQEGRRGRGVRRCGVGEYGAASSDFAARDTAVILVQAQRRPVPPGTGPTRSSPARRVYAGTRFAPGGTGSPPARWSRPKSAAEPTARDHRCRRGCPRHCDTFCLGSDRVSRWLPVRCYLRHTAVRLTRLACQELIVRSRRPRPWQVDGGRPGRPGGCVGLEPRELRACIVPGRYPRAARPSPKYSRS